MSAPGRTAETGSWFERHARVLAWGCWSLVLLLALSPSLAPEESLPDESTASEAVAIVSFYIFMLSMSTVGAFVATRRPSNPLPWIMLFASFWYAIAAFSDSYGRTLDEGDSITGVLAFFSSVSWLIGLGTAGTYLLLLFPDGHLPSPRWKVVAWSSFIGLFLFVVGTAITPGPLEDIGGDIENPFGIPGAEAVGQAVAGLGFSLMLPSVLLSIGSIVLRYRRSRADTRQQMKWLVFGVAMIGVAIVASFVLESVFKSESATNLSNGLITVAVSLIPISIGISVLKYRLYDIDVVINKTIVFGALAAFITGIYVAMVVGFGTLLGSQDEPNLALSIAATAIVAIAFSPVKERTQHVANRLVYGHRLSPYEVLTDLSRTVAAAPVPNEVLRGVAHAAVAGVNARGAMVTLDLQDGSKVMETHPEDLSTESAGSSETFEVVHESENLGRITVYKDPGDALRPQDVGLLEDLSAQAGLALHNARLALELRARLDEIERQATELQESRARIVSAADDSRRRLERDISEGPRADLVGLREELKKVQPLVDADPEAAARRLESLTADANTTLDGLRELARGIYPPLLADKGLVAALDSHIRKHGLPIEVVVPDDMRETRFPESVETAAYFCCVEAMRGGRVERVEVGPGDELSVSISVASLPPDQHRNIEDRIEAQGGRVDRLEDAIVLGLPVSDEEVPHAEAVAHASSSSSGPN